MIRFGCPRCKSVLECPDQSIGKKRDCPKCGQRLQVPAPPPNRTVLGSFLSAGPAPAEGARLGLRPRLIGCPKCSAKLYVLMEQPKLRPDPAPLMVFYPVFLVTGIVLAVGIRPGRL